MEGNKASAQPVERNTYAEAGDIASWVEANRWCMDSTGDSESAPVGQRKYAGLVKAVAGEVAAAPSFPEKSWRDFLKAAEEGNKEHQNCRRKAKVNDSWEMQSSCAAEEADHDS